MIFLSLEDSGPCQNRKPWKSCLKWKIYNPITSLPKTQKSQPGKLQGNTKKNDFLMIDLTVKNIKTKSNIIKIQRKTNKISLNQYIAIIY